MELADIMVYDEKIQSSYFVLRTSGRQFENDVLAHEASLKLAKANFYKKKISIGRYNK